MKTKNMMRNSALFIVGVIVSPLLFTAVAVLNLFALLLKAVSKAFQRALELTKELLLKTMDWQNV